MIAFRESWLVDSAYLCILLSAEKAYCELATIMQNQEDLEFTR